jgi:hypothetical protein
MSPTNQIGMSFEAVATLDNRPGDTVNACSSGQVLRVTDSWTDNMVHPVLPDAQPNPPAGALALANGANFTVVASVPNGDPLFTANPWNRVGADQYTNAMWPNRWQMNVTNQRIRWYDSPKMGAPLNVPFANVNQLLTRLDFVSYVNGSQGRNSCWCDFTFEAVWNRNANPAVTAFGGGPAPAGATIIAGVNCTSAPSCSVATQVCQADSDCCRYQGLVCTNNICSPGTPQPPP